MVVEAPTLGEGWLAVSRAILADGALATYDRQARASSRSLTLVVADPSPDDDVIARLGDPRWLDWMHANFFDRKDVASWATPRATRRASSTTPAAGATSSRGSSIACAPTRSRRSATITTFQPLTDTSYVPCVSMLDFWLRDGAVELVVYAHSLDFGKKAYGNLVELARLQEHVAGELGAATGALVVHAKSAHVYEPEWSAMASIAGAVEPAAQPSSSA